MERKEDDEEHEFAQRNEGTKEVTFPEEDDSENFNDGENDPENSMNQMNRQSQQSASRLSQHSSGKRSFGNSIDSPLTTPMKPSRPTDECSVGTATSTAKKKKRAKENSIKVAVRCRPMNDRELDMGDMACVEIEDDTLTISADPDGTGQVNCIGGRSARSKNPTRAFTFDYCYGPESEQAQVFEDIGTGVLENAFAGYNASVFAYGQTGSGKTHTMLGSGVDAGLIPRICWCLVEKLHETEQRGDPETSCLGTGAESTTYSLEASYLEIYNERCIDLLAPPPNNSEPSIKLRVREDPKSGPYVEDLTTVPVRSMHEIRRMMAVGARARTVAATNMNNKSSRSHAIFTLVFKQTTISGDLSSATDTVSKINLVDLAGSERVSASGVKGRQLTETANINRSLHTLGRVINALSRSSGRKRGYNTPSKDNLFGTPTTSGGAPPLIPYRDSTLTWLLKPSLGGNSRTTMFATVSPAMVNFEESLTTLRYAQECSRVVNKAIVNRDKNVEIINELRTEIDLLRERLAYHTQTSEQVASLEEANKQMEAQILEQVGAKRRHVETIRMIEGQLEQSEAVRNGLEGELDKAKAALEDTLNRLAESEANREAAQTEIVQLKKKLEDLSVMQVTRKARKAFVSKFASFASLTSSLRKRQRQKLLKQDAENTRQTTEADDLLESLEDEEENQIEDDTALASSTAHEDGDAEPMASEDDINSNNTKKTKKSWRGRLKKLWKKIPLVSSSSTSSTKKKNKK
ncbi:Kinesin-like protein KIF16B [Hondaea fermentalgiana]|uniref:Kinesin-like protein n=1 Tax=Hondaea fermentalgiana TaxID=2315210 RepID=A0A2R5GP57_9STRA|nr:Kinesin-like protein KIF16B [Hondaea fermentalgiana]|eukprot:GBG32405.1 Kinesin-like protein KIF16B [Hondaea fermentalgiana]